LVRLRGDRARPGAGRRAPNRCVLIQLPKTNSKLLVLIATACVDMMGTFIVVPLLPFYATRMGANALVVTGMISAFALASLISSPLWGRFSDRYGRRPALLIALGASAISYVVFAFAGSISVLLLSRLVQGAGGGTVGVVQAYVADATEPKDRARALGWLSAATNVGVAFGPVLGTWAVYLGLQHLKVNGGDFSLGSHAPGLVAAAVCVANMYFCWRYLRESHQVPSAVRSHIEPPGRASTVILSVLCFLPLAVLRGLRIPTEDILQLLRRLGVRIEGSGEGPAPRLIWIYAVAIGAWLGVVSILALFLKDQFAVTVKTIGWFFAYVGAMNVVARLFFLGPAVDRFGEARLSRIGTVLLALGLILIPLSKSLPMLALAVALLPLGTAFTFPCVTAMLSRVISPTERGLYMGVQQTFGGVTRVLFPLGAGFLYDHFIPGVAFWVGATLVASTLLLNIKLPTSLRQEPAREMSPRAEAAREAATEPAALNPSGA
jgi:MFS family permease